MGPPLETPHAVDLDNKHIIFESFRARTAHWLPLPEPQEPNALRKLKSPSLVTPLTPRQAPLVPYW